MVSECTTQIRRFCEPFRGELYRHFFQRQFLQKTVTDGFTSWSCCNFTGGGGGELERVRPVFREYIGTASASSASGCNTLDPRVLQDVNRMYVPWVLLVLGFLSCTSSQQSLFLYAWHHWAFSTAHPPSTRSILGRHNCKILFITRRRNVLGTPSINGGTSITHAGSTRELTP